MRKHSPIALVCLTGCNHVLKCVVQGTPVEFPDDILITNESSSTIVQGTKIAWSMTGFPGGTHVLEEDLAPGKGFYILGALPGGMEAGRKCTANVQP